MSWEVWPTPSSAPWSWWRLATFIGTPIGIMAGIYLAEYNAHGALASVVRFVNDILLSAPSIIIGLFVYAVVVVYFKQFSGSGRRAGVGIDRDSGGDSHDGKHVATGATWSCAKPPMRSGTPKWKVIMAITLRAARVWRGDRRAAGGCAHCRRNGAAAVHCAQQSVLDLRSDTADGQLAGHDLQIRHESVRKLAASGMGRRVADHCCGARDSTFWRAC